MMMMMKLMMMMIIIIIIHNMTYIEQAFSRRVNNECLVSDQYALKNHQLNYCEFRRKIIINNNNKNNKSYSAGVNCFDLFLRSGLTRRSQPNN